MAKKKTSEVPKHVTTLQMPEVWYEAMRDRAHAERTSMADLIREAIKAQYNLPCDCCPPK